VLYLLHYQLLPEQRLAALMADLFGVKLVTATIARISQDWAHRFMGFADAVRDHVATAPVKHPRFRRGAGYGRNRLSHWWQDAVAAHRLDCLAHFLPCLGEAGLPEVTGIVVHDHWKPPAFAHRR
jgi:transposase